MALRVIVGLASALGVVATLRGNEPESVGAQDRPGTEARAETGDAAGGKARRDTFFSFESRTLTGDWRGRLEAQGVRVNVFLNDQYQSVVKGGVESGGSGRNSGSVDALLSFDLDKLGVAANSEALLHLQANWGGGINNRTGGLFQVNDDSDGSIGGHVAQLWYRRHFPAQRASLTMGYLDYQTIVDRNRYSNSEDKQFMHQTLDNNPLVPLRIGMGASLTLKPVSWYTLIVGVADGQARPYKGGVSRAFHEEDWFTVYLENGFATSIKSRRGELPGHYRFGFFYDPGPRRTFPRDEQDDRSRAGDYGMYASLDQMVYREREGEGQGFGVFARFGYRSPENHRMSRFWSGGLSYTGLIPTRDKDVLGLAFSLLRSSHHYRRRVDERWASETVYELYYAIRVSPWLVVTPDVQYVDHPGAAGDVGHAVVAGVRVRVSL